MSRVERDPERGRAAAAKLEALGARRILVKAAEQGYITQLACKMPECFCPEELGGACYFEPVTPELSDWMPTVEHYPLPKREGGKETVDNVLLAHRLCNRIDFSISDDRSYASDLTRIRKAREDAIRRNNEVPSSVSDEGASGRDRDGLTLGDVPRVDGPWQEINEFAHTFDGYAHFGEAWGERFNAVRQGYVANGQLPAAIDDLRACLFLEFRGDRFTWGDDVAISEPDAEGVRHIVGNPDFETSPTQQYRRAVIARIRELLGER